MSDVKQSWADDEDVLPQTEVIEHGDGTKSVISYKLNDAGRRIKVTQKIRVVTTREKVDHTVAERKKWAKFGRERGHGPGPNSDTTSVEPDFAFKLSTASTKKTEPEPVAEPAAEAKISCRICSGVHFTAKCPYKDTLGVPEEEKKDDEPLEPVAGAKIGSKYQLPHLRAGAPARTDRGDVENTTLRVSNLSEDVNEDELRGLCGNFGRVTRCYVVKDRETNRNRGFAFVSFETPQQAELACKKLNGYGLDNLIIRVEFSKK